MTKESTREKYKKDTGAEPLTKIGAKTSAYKEYLLSEKCTEPWLSNWGALYSKNKETPYTKGTDLLGDLKKLDRANRLDEKCIRGGVGRGENLRNIAEFRKESKKKYDVENY